jgi:septum formation protein
MGVPYEVVATTGEEAVDGDSATTLAAANAVAKLHRAVLPGDAPAGAFVLGTDTLVTLDGRVMGKPVSRADAVSMITELAGKTHQVVSGVALRRIGGAGEGTALEPGEQLHVATATTEVTFLSLDESQIEAYIASGEWTDKAGAYGVQGLAGMFVSEVRGEYSNVVGLPLCLLARLFRDAGFDLLRRQWI